MRYLIMEDMFNCDLKKVKTKSTSKDKEKKIKS